MASSSACQTESHYAPRESVPCKVCDRPSFYTYYLVRCCEGCKQFFRRVLLNKKAYACKKDRNGICVRTKGKRCLGCRLDRCLVAGMRPRVLHQQSNDAKWCEFVRRLEERKRQISNGTTKIGNKSDMAFDDGDCDNVDRLNEQGDDGDGKELEMQLNMQKKRNTPIKRQIAESQQNMAVALVKAPMLSNVAQWQQLDWLLLLEGRQSRTWKATTDLSAWLSNFHSLQELIRFPGYLLPQPFNVQPHKQQQQSRQLLSSLPELQDERRIGSGAMCPAAPVVINFICIDALLYLDWARTLPAFTELDANDQLVLLKCFFVPFCSLCNAFYSANAFNAGTWTRGNGHVFHNFQNYGELWNDQRLRVLSERVFCKSVEAIRTLQIGREEFVLLLAIICSNSNADEQSPTGREKLYKHSTQYCRFLMRFLQQRHGDEAGVKKFADCMQLLELMLRMKNRMEMLHTFWGVSVLTNQRMRQQAMSEFPRSLALFNLF